MSEHVQFEWDRRKDAGNRAKHGVAFEDAALVWSDPGHLIRFDRVQESEERWHALGLAGGVVLLLVVHTYPDEDENAVRIVSARKATKREREAYHSGAF